MYCVACREERESGANWCTACGAKLQPRAKELVRAELEHVRFLLDELGRWDAARVPDEVRKYLEGRYRKREWILAGVLSGTDAPRPAESPAPARSAVPVPSATDTAPPGAAASAPPPTSPPPAPSSIPAAPGRDARAQGQRRRPVPVPETPLAPSFEAPLPRTPEQRILEEASTWSRLWKPFLYESVGWFVGGFLILAGTLFFVAESWAGMTTTLRSMVVFGLTAGYSAGFSAWGRFFLRRQKVVGAGRILGLIGSAAAPLPALALIPLAWTAPIPFWAALLLWSLVAAWLAGAPADAHEPAVRPVLQIAMGLTTAAMALAPFLASLGPFAIWVNAVAVLWLAVALEAPGVRRGAFAIAAPTYLGLLLAIRIHVALASAGMAVPVAAYAPLVAALGLVVVRARGPAPSGRALDPVALGVVAVQVAAVAGSVVAPAPAFFLSSALCTATLWHLGRGDGVRARWHYATYAVGYLAYQSVGTVVPGPLLKLFLRVKEALGYASQPYLPPNFAAVYAVPYVVGVAAFAARLVRSEHVDPVERARQRAVGSVLLNATAVGAALFCAEAMAGTDLRPGLWAVPPLAATCLSLGLWLRRRLLAWVGSMSLLSVPVAVGAVYSVPAGILSAGALAAALAVLSWRVPRSPSHGRTAAAAALALGAGIAAVLPEHSLLSAAGVALASGAMALVAIRRQEPWAWAACGALALLAPAVGVLAITSAAVAQMVLAGAALALAAGSRRKEMEAWGPVAVMGAVAAATWSTFAGANGPVPALAVGWVTCLLASRSTRGWSPVIGAPMLALAISLDVGSFHSLPPVPRELAMGLLAAMALGASAWTAWRGRSAAAFSHGFCALAAAFAIALSRTFLHSPHHWTMVAASAIALLAARAVLPRLCVAWAAVLAVIAASGQNGEMEVWVAVAFTALAALEEWPRARGLLLGPRPVATVASAGAVAALLSWRVDLHPGDEAALAAVACALALGWARTSGRSIFLAAPALLAAPWTGVPDEARWAMLVLLPLWSVAVVRSASWSPRALNRLVPGGSPDRVSLWTLGALFASAGIHVLSDAPDARWLAYAAGGALLLAGGPFQTLRIACAAALALPYPEARLAGVAALLGVGFLHLHAPGIASFLTGPAEQAEPAGPGERQGKQPGAAEAWLRTPGVCAVAAVALAAAHWLSAAIPAGDLLAPGLLLLGGALWAAALLTGWRWALGVAAFATGAGLTELGLTPVAGLAAGALGSAVLAALLRSEAVQARAHDLAARLGTGIAGAWSRPFWSAGAIAAVLAVGATLSGHGDWRVAAPLLVAGALLVWTPDRVEAALGCGLFGLVSFSIVPEAWRPVSGAAAGLALGLVARFLEGRVPRPDILRHAGWVVGLLSLAGLHALGHASTPVACALVMLSAWAAVWGDERLEWVGWTASLAWLHVGLMHAGIVLSTGQPKTLILPYLGAASALVAAVALWLGPEANRRTLGLWAVALALAEVSGGLMLLHMPVEREALVAGIALASLAISAVATARRDGDEGVAYVAQLALTFGYLVARRHGAGGPFGQGDALVALLAGAAFGGLYGWASRQPSPAFRRPAMVGAIALPLAGLLAAPWDSQPLICAALLVGLSAHFAAMARRPALRSKLSILSAVAFNAALLVAWKGSGAGEPQYYLIPAAISVLVLLRIFRDQVEDLTRARLRALALTALYGAAAWKPLMFESTWAMLLCVLVCVVGVAVGVSTRIRSYVYLGTGFLVVTISANLIRHGLRDHRLGAAFLSVLGLLVVGFMVLLSARREELLRRYERVRQLLTGWE